MSGAIEGTRAQFGFKLSTVFSLQIHYGSDHFGWLDGSISAAVTVEAFGTDRWGTMAAHASRPNHTCPPRNF